VTRSAYTNGQGAGRTPTRSPPALVRGLPELATHHDVGGPVEAPLVHHRQSRVELFDVQGQRRGSEQILGRSLTRDEYRIVGADMFHGADLAAIPRQRQLRGQAREERGRPFLQLLVRAEPSTNGLRTDGRQGRHLNVSIAADAEIPVM
jgi:hypothetical protein